MAWKYVGPSDAVEVPEFGVVVERGETTDAIPEDAVFGSDWEHVKPKTAKKQES